VTADGQCASVADEVTACFGRLASLLSRYALTLAHLAHVNLLLASMADFPAANAAYVTHFPHGSPPTRACVGVRLPKGKRVELDVVATTRERKALHVQSLSYWAPANIGPYSQAVSVRPYHGRLS
jgi:diphthine-ammonia ligase